MPLPTRSKSVRLPQTSKAETNQDSQSSSNGKAPVKSDALPSRSQQTSTTIPRRTAIGTNQHMLKPTSNSSSVHVETKQTPKLNTKPSIKTSATAAPNLLGPSRRPAASTQASESQLQTRNLQHGHSRNLSTANPSLRIPSTGHQRTQSIPALRNVSNNSFAADVKKPGFNTFQQHYSPLKPNVRAPDPLKLANKQSESKSVAGDTDTDTNAIDDELLQLQILHQDSIGNLRQYEARVGQRIHGISTELEQQKGILHKHQQDHAKMTSLNSLKVWIEDEKMPISQSALYQLSRVVEEITGLAKTYENPDGPLSKFTSWYEQARMTRNDRKLQVDRTLGPLLVPTLGESWRQDMERIESRVAVCKALLQSMKMPRRDNSGVYLVFQRHLTLAETLHDLAQMALDVEKAIMSSEQIWMNQAIENALVDHYRRSSESQNKEHVPAWQVS